MKKFFLGLVLSMGLAVGATAQERALSYRVEVGGNLSNVSYSGNDKADANNYKAKVGLRASLGVEYSLGGSGLYTYGDLGYRNLGTKMTTISELAKNKDNTYFTLHSASLGAGLGYRFAITNSLKLSFEGGLLGSYTLSGKQKTGAVSIDVFGKDINKENRPNRAALEANFSAALEFQRFYLRIGTEQAITKLINQQKESLRGMDAYLTIGIRL